MEMSPTGIKVVADGVPESTEHGRLALRLLLPPGLFPF
jgi:hypothetical protein